MTRRIAIKTKSAIKFYELTNTERPLTIVENRLYRTDERFMVSNATQPDEFVLYDLDSPYMYCVPGLEIPTPDDTMMLIDVARGNKRMVNKVGRNWGKTIRKNFGVILLAVIVGYWMITKLL